MTFVSIKNGSKVVDFTLSDKFLGEHFKMLINLTDRFKIYMCTFFYFIEIEKQTSFRTLRKNWNTKYVVCLIDCLFENRDTSFFGPYLRIKVFSLGNF